MSFVRTRNTSNQPAWARLNSKAQGPTWVQIDPGIDVSVSQTNQLRNLGLERYSDVAAVAVVFTQPV